MSGDPNVVQPPDSQDGRTWFALERVLEDRVADLESEIKFLREMLRLALASHAQIEEQS